MIEITAAEIVIGIDTHKDIHAAVAMSGIGARLGATTIPATLAGYRTLQAWAERFGTIRAFGVEGTGSFGAGLSRFLQASGHTVIDVNRPNRQLRHQHGKSDTLDAESAARSVLSGQADTQPKTGTGAVEMIRHFKVARDTAVKSRTQAMVTLKTLIVNAPAVLRQTLDVLRGKMTLIRHLAALRPGPVISTAASVKTALRAIARRWLTLNAEINAHDADLEALTTAQAPAMLKAPGIAFGTTAEMLILVGDNPQRIRSEAAFAKLCGVCPVPASSGKSSRSRLNRGGNRQANAALYRVVIVRMYHHRPTIEYVRKRTAEGKTKREIIRCLKRFVAREVFGYLCRPQRTTNPTPETT